MESTFQTMMTSIVSSQKLARTNSQNSRYPDRFVRQAETAETGYTYYVHEWKKPNGEIGFKAFFRATGDNKQYVIEYTDVDDTITNIGWVDDEEV